MSIKKGIILAGGAGSRLYPLTLVASKQLQPIYDKPMIYYPLSTLMHAGVGDILIISTPQDTPRFETLLGDGSRWGISLSYMVQPVALILGDNIFYGKMELESIFAEFAGGARVFGYPVTDPERYGVVEFDKYGHAIGIEEKPAKPKSRYAVPGLYLYDKKVVELTKELRPSARDELEITDLNLAYLQRHELMVEKLERGIAWLDTGTHMSLLEASHFIGTLEARQGVKIACLEEVAYRKGFIDKGQFQQVVEDTPKSSYREYLEQILNEEF